jgi:hypothetical protein
MIKPFQNLRLIFLTNLLFQENINYKKKNVIKTILEEEQLQLKQRIHKNWEFSSMEYKSLK